MTPAHHFADAVAHAGTPAEGIASGAAVKDASTRRGRYEFLDALRGVAAMAVVIQHAMELVWPTWARFSISYFRPGEFGVVLFFLCSGFIIPASLERHGSQSRFWIGRFFRLYPLYWFALATALALHFGLGRYPLDPAYLDHPVWMTAANATILQDFLGASLALGQSWSLSYELVFYGIVAALFVAGLHRKSAALALGGFALMALTVTGRVPGLALAHSGPRLIATLALATLGAALIVARFARRAGAKRWVAVALVVISVLLVANRPENLRSAFFFFATLFTGTALYRWTAGQLSTTAIAAVVAAGLGSIVVLCMTTDFDPEPGAHLRRAEIVTYAGAYSVFIAALLARGARFPRSLLFLGTISYSLYLNHSLVIYGLGWMAHNGWITATTWVGLSVIISGVTYRLIERPAIDIGRRVGVRPRARVDAQAS